MLEKDKKTELGVIKIHNNVIAQIATIASKEVQGVVDVERGFIASFLESTFGKPIFNRGVNVETFENDVKINISVAVEYGSNIPLVATRIQESVKSAIEKMSGLSLVEVNVNVKEVKSIKKSR